VEGSSVDPPEGGSSMKSRMKFGVFLVILGIIGNSSGYYLPGVAPVDFEENEPVELKVNKLTSVHTQLPYRFYSLPFCTPKTIIDKVENIGEILRGDRIENSLYEVDSIFF
jgi:transmembrane 9 superfamily protein 2/4